MMFARSDKKKNSNYSTGANFAAANCNAFKFNILKVIGTVVSAVSIFVFRLINVIINIIDIIIINCCKTISKSKKRILPIAG